jgi:hypothetical protein
LEQNDIENRFAYHQPSSDEIANAHQSVRHVCATLARVLNFMLPEGREKSLAITHLEETMMWANAAIARSQEVMSNVVQQAP